MIFFFVLFYPLIIFINIFFTGYLLNLSGSLFIFSFYSTLAGTFLFILIMLHLSTSSVFIFTTFTWIKASTLIIKFSFMFDSLALIMLFLVFFVSTAVHWYSFEYMKTDPNIIKFISYLSLFTFFMFMLILASNLGLFFAAWEGVGICSFLLISFWNTRISSCKSGLKSMFLNRIGDLGFLISIAIIFNLTHSLEFYILYAYLPFFYTYVWNVNAFLSVPVLEVIVFFLFVGVCGKSAQLGLHVWLLDAMDGPTPVSALIHAATMVTAGVYLLIRCSFFIEYTLYIKIFISLVGLTTALFASVICLFQNDIKSIIAYSTCSQLGYMVAVCGFSGYSLAFFHLLNHGFFKALLFLSSGLVIHNFFDEQDIRRMGGLLFLMPLTYSFFIVGSFSLIGLPFLSGYFSKDLIIEFFLGLPFYWSNFFFHLSLISALFTTIYSIRLFFYVFWAKPLNSKFFYSNCSEFLTLSTLSPLLLLVAFSIFSGWFFKNMFYQIFVFFFFDTIFLVSNFSKNLFYLEYIFLQNFSLWFCIKLLPVYFFMFSVFFSLSYLVNSLFWVYIIRHVTSYFYIYVLFHEGFFYNYIYFYIVNKLGLRILTFFYLLDKFFFEFTVVHYLLLNIKFLSRTLYSINFNKLYFNYLYFSILILFSVILYFL